MNVKILPSTAKGDMEAPPSKSMAHRLIICAGLAEGESIIENVDCSQDILATLDCLTALGAKIRWEKPGILYIRGTDISRFQGTDIGRFQGTDTCSTRGTDISKLQGTDISSTRKIDIKRTQEADIRRIMTEEKSSDTESSPILPCRECGSTLRFFIPLCLTGEEKKILTGSDTLFSRPLDIYEEICRGQGLLFEKGKNSLAVGGRLKGGDYEIPGNISSQFISGLLFALPLLEKDSRIRLIPPVESRPYIDMTIQALAQFNIHVRWEDESQGASKSQGASAFTLFVPGRQRYRPCNVRVEGDYSNAAFFEALNLAGGNVTLEGLSPDCLQGDKIYRKYFNQLEAGYAEIDIADCPDLGPVLIVVAAMKQGARFTGTRRLKIKESDRGLAMKQELGKLGIEITVNENEILVPGGILEEEILTDYKDSDKTFTCKSIPDSIVLDGHNDHRIVMALSILLTRTGGRIRGAEAVNKSLPDFFDRLKGLGIGVEYDELDK